MEAAGNRSSQCEITIIELDRLRPDPWQARAALDEALTCRVEQDIEANGLQYPLQVRPLRDQPCLFGVYDGWHRLASLQRLAERFPERFSRVPCQIREIDDATALTLSLVLNRERGELSALEQADALVRLHDLTGMTWKEVRQRTHFESDGYVRALAATSRNICPELREINNTQPIQARLLIPIASQPEAIQQWAGRLLKEGRSIDEILRHVLPRPDRSRSRLTGILLGLRQRWVSSTGEGAEGVAGLRDEAAEIRDLLLEWVAQIDAYLARAPASDSGSAIDASPAPSG